MERGKILALDVATRTGVAEGRPGEVPRLQTVDFRAGDDLSMLYANATTWLATKLRDDQPDLVVIERVVPPSGAMGHTNHDTTMISIGTFAIMCGIVRCKNVRLEYAPINTWRKHFLGHGRLPGAQAKRQAQQRCALLGWDAPDHNAAEAGGIWDWACQTFMGRIPTELHLFGERKKTAGGVNAG